MTAQTNPVKENIKNEQMMLQKELPTLTKDFQLASLNTVDLFQMPQVKSIDVDGMGTAKKQNIFHTRNNELDDIQLEDMQPQVKKPESRSTKRRQRAVKKARIGTGNFVQPFRRERQTTHQQIKNPRNQGGNI